MANIGAIVLAAGKSSRMGESKLLLPLQKSPLITSALSAALSLRPVICVTGAYQSAIEEALLPYKDALEIHYNSHFESGMASSLKLGVQALRGRVDGAMIFLGDQPFVPVEVVKALVSRYVATRACGVKIIRPVYGGKLGHPILFDQSLFEEFATLTGDVGAREIIARHQKEVALVYFEESRWGADIDTPADYKMLVKRDDAK